jgi:hypothetical protein
VNRRDLVNMVTARHASRVERHRLFIKAAPSRTAARARLTDSLRKLPGVASDPDTVEHILLLMDAHNDAIKELP